MKGSISSKNPIIAKVLFLKSFYISIALIIYKLNLNGAQIISKYSPIIGIKNELIPIKSIISANISM